jgi:hypothetical protein
MVLQPVLDEVMFALNVRKLESNRSRERVQHIGGVTQGRVIAIGC